MRWWSDFTFTKNQHRYWQLGNCILGIQRAPQQWRIAYEYFEELEPEIKCGVTKLTHIDSDSLTFKYYTTTQTAEKIYLTPVLADRPQVSRPEVPFYISGSSQVQLYVSSPAWVRIATSQQILQEIPTQRLSDTWFGENTLEGQLCYASRTRCRTELDKENLHPLRVLTQVTIANHTEQNFLVQRIKLPLPSLSIYANEKNNLWTENLVIEITSTTEGMLSRIENSAPENVGQIELISGPRIMVKSNRIIDIFSQIL